MRCIVFPLAHIWTLIIISPFTFLYHERHFVFPSKVCVYILYLYSWSFYPRSWSYVYTVIGCNYIQSPKFLYRFCVRCKLQNTVFVLFYHLELRDKHRLSDCADSCNKTVSYLLQDSREVFFSTRLTSEIQEKHTCKCTSLRKLGSYSKVSKWPHFPSVCSKSCNFLVP